VIPSLAAVATPVSSPGASEIRFLCAFCGQKLSAGQDMVGMQIECPSCRRSLTVPKVVS
jgi:DNA-directed RNA polymerase subunit RPC12/RpoP